MTRGAFLKKYFLRFAVALTLASLIVYVLYHVFGSGADGLMQTPVRRITDEQILSGEAYLFRDESVLTVTDAGLVNDLAVSGTKVSKGVPVTEVWSVENADSLASDQLRLDSLNRVITVLENSRVSADTPLSKAEEFRAEALEEYLAVCRAVQRGEWSALSATEDEFLTYLNRYAALTGSAEAIEETLTRLKAERAELLDGTRVTVNNEYASGYFYDRTCVDGYEDILNAAALEGLTADRFFELIGSTPNPVSEGQAVGKMSYGYDWYFGVSFEMGENDLFRIGREYTFRLPENRDMELTMVCELLLRHTDGRLVAVFSSNDHPTDMTYLRTQRVEITVGYAKGYYVPESALRTVGGMEGVYIFKDSTVYFRRIEVLYRGDGYCIVAEQNGREGYLALYDMLVTSGKKLYDGKVIK